MADTLVRNEAPQRVNVPVLHPDVREAALPRATWVLAVGALAAGVGAFLPWFAPHGAIDLTTRVPDETLSGWDLVGFSFPAAVVLGIVGVVGALLVASGGRSLPFGLNPRKAVAWSALVAGLVALAGLYTDWRDVPATTGIGQDAWDNATVSGFHVSSGPQPGAWLVLTGAILAALAAAWLLRILIRVVAMTYLGGLVVLPVYTVIDRTFSNGAKNVWDVLTTDQDFLDAVKLTLVVAGIAVVVNTIFGLGIALLLTRYEFPGRRLLSMFVDLPLAISPVVVGVALILVYGQDGWFGSQLADVGIQVIFSTPGMVLGTIIVALPLVVREIVPVLEETGVDQEQAAQSLGANSWQTFRRVTLPTIKWALAYGVVLSLARSLGEFGAVRVVSRSVSGDSQTVTLWINSEYEQLGKSHVDNAFIGSFFLMLVAVAFIVVIAVLRPKEEKKN